jgi:hypothetical protein
MIAIVVAVIVIQDLGPRFTTKCISQGIGSPLGTAPFLLTLADLISALVMPISLWRHHPQPC